MDFVRSYFGTNEPFEPVEHFSPHFRSALIWEKSEEKSVQLVRGSFVPK